MDADAPPENPSRSPRTRLRALIDSLRHRRVVRWGLDLLLFLIVVVGIGAYQTRHHPRNTPLPEMTLDALSGPPVDLQALSGPPTLLVIWAPWCGVCKATSSNVSRVKRWLGGHAQVVSIAVEYQNLAQVQAYVQEQGVDYPVLLGNKSLLARLRVEAYPTFFFLDDRGRIEASSVGYTTTAGILLRLLL